MELDRQLKIDKQIGHIMNAKLILDYLKILNYELRSKKYSTSSVIRSNNGKSITLFSEESSYDSNEIKDISEIVITSHHKSNESEKNLLKFKRQDNKENWHIEFNGITDDEVNTVDGLLSIRNKLIPQTNEFASAS
jgi:hypothetical protein